MTKPDNFHILVAFVGGPGMDKLIGMEITVTDSRGRNWTQSIGSRETMTALKAPSSQTFTGQYSGKNHVVVTGYFSDGSQKVLIDKDI